MSMPLLSPPAGLSSDTLDPPIPTRTVPDDHWSDAHETDEERGVIQEIHEQQEDLTIQHPKLSAADDKTHEVNTPSPTAGTPNDTQQRTAREVEAGSVHSLPVVHVTEPSSPPAPISSRSTSTTFPASPASSLAPTTASSQERRARNRLTIDNRASNRISGFFSNLIHRRDHPPTATRETAAPSPPPLPRETSRPSSPSPQPSRASTPPPCLPAPSLIDLGLSLSSVTSHLSPSHFSSPPCSGAFLQPHYLLICHSQGLDVLPLMSPPVPQPYSLIRRVPFKSVVVMEHRGVLVAIAGRRDGVRVYALEEVKRAIEWRMEMEVKREREKARREEVKKALMASHDARDKKISSDKDTRGRGPPPLASSLKARPDRRATVSVPSSASSNSLPRSSTIRQPKTPPSFPIPSGPPPAYTPPAHSRTNSTLPTINHTLTRVRTTSVNDVLAGAVSRRRLSQDDNVMQNDSKNGWASSDDEAIDLVAAPSGSQALDERTSASGPSPPAPSRTTTRLEVPTLPRTSSAANTHPRRSRPANLDLSLTRADPPMNAVPTVAPPSPTPTLLTLRETIMASSTGTNALPTRSSLTADRQHESLDGDPDGDADEEEEGEAMPSVATTPTRERISLAEALMESRLPDAGPVGSRRTQDAILLNNVGSPEDDMPVSPRTSDSFSQSTRTRRSMGDSIRRRRRWSVFDGFFSPTSSQPSVSSVPERSDAETIVRPMTASQPEFRQPGSLSRSQSTRQLASASASTLPPETPTRPSTAPGHHPGSPTGWTFPPSTSSPATPQPTPSSSSRFLPRIITNAFHHRRSEDLPASPTLDAEFRRNAGTPTTTQAQAPKLEYVKLPGTKGSVMVKAVETAKKSFLAILCGDNGEKVELFAGTYRTALGLSRTFILPDSPRSLELQLQGDDLVEVFLVFAQNVFGLEPATVRVREVRINRAERRAARRRAREVQQTTDATDGDGAGAEDDTAVNVTIGVAIAGPTPEDGNQLAPSAYHPADTPATPTQLADTSASTPTLTNTDELVTLAAAQMSPYTTFQQLPFAPNFPLAGIADEYIIPPTYLSFMDYRDAYEPELNDSQNEGSSSHVQLPPPGLPVPTASPPSKWFYKDPKGVVHGPWKANLMQAWYKDGLLPLDLPVRREDDQEFILLKDLRLQSVDPVFPFKSPAPPPTLPQQQAILPVDPAKPLLSPMSLLTQPRHYGPPALFFSSRGGHSTTIVDARGRSVLKGRFLWTPDEDDDEAFARLGDVKRLEAFDVEDRAVLVAMRQGGLEVVDFGDALLLPADHSRSLLPHFHPPTSSVNRRGPFVWKIGASTALPSPGIPPLPALPPKPPTHRFHGKKQSTGPTKSPGRSDFLMGDTDSEHSRDEMLFLGRQDDNVYFCERRASSFRVLRLSTSSPSS